MPVAAADQQPVRHVRSAQTGQQQSLETPVLLLLCAVVGGLFNRHAPEAYMVSNLLTWRHYTEGWLLVCITLLGKRAQSCFLWLLKAKDCAVFCEYSLLSTVSTVSIQQPCSSNQDSSVYFRPV